ncbi:MAG: zf-HC2 domain-containing protein [Candidatus Omnitrophica bacterium]|nr:zf-HC2 domain-containing protein [Candidatus Omnitrophota bacterium]
MNCKRAEKLILTDYIDGNLKGRALEEIELHIRSCPGCHALAQDLKAAGKLFRAVPRQEAPSEVWRKIRDEISAAPVRRYFPEIALEYARYHLSHLKPAIVMAGAAVLLLFVLATMRLMPHKDYLEAAIQQDDIAAISYGSDEEDGSEYDLGTPAEMFFL